MKKNLNAPKGGFKLKLKGEAERIVTLAKPSDYYGIKPSDFHYVVPKMLVSEGEKVSVGTPLFYDKKSLKVKFVSPVSGVLESIVRGPKRKIEVVKIKADVEGGKDTVQNIGERESMDREKLVETLLNFGLWTFVRQRPYDTIANPDDTPKSIFVSCFDTRPLGADIDFLINKCEKSFKEGVEVLKKLTNGKVFLNLTENTSTKEKVEEIQGVEVSYFKNRHPAGNVGFQIHTLDPIAKGETVWYLDIQDLFIIGDFFLTKKLNFTKLFAVCGSEIISPHYFRAKIGATVSSLIQKKLKTETNIRCISGNILSGQKVERDGFVGFYDTSLTVIEEKKNLELLSWLMPNFNKFSISRSYFSWLFPRKEYALNTRMNGEERAFVMTGEYERVIGLDIYPMQLMKAIIANDIEQMENLGIYEVVEEDLATCEFVCTSKMPLQKMLREGLDTVRNEYISEH